MTKQRYLGMKSLNRIVLLLVATLATVACDPEERFQLDRERDIVYSLQYDDLSPQPQDGVTNKRVHLATESEWQELLDQFCDWAEEGAAVTFAGADSYGNPKQGGHSPKESTTFSTTDREAMKEWMARMEDEGKTVTVTFDRATGTWNGTAYATAPRPVATGGLITYASVEWDDGLRSIWSFDTTNLMVYITHTDEYQYFAAVDAPYGICSYRHAYEVDTHCAYWLFDNTGDSTLYYLRFDDGASDTLFFSNLSNTYQFTLVRNDSWQTWLCRQPFDIVLHLVPWAAETYPEMGYSQVWSDAYRVNCASVFHPGQCHWYLYQTDRTDVDWELSLHYTANDVVDSLGVIGYPNSQGESRTMTVKDLRQYPGCASEYVFSRWD